MNSGNLHIAQIQPLFDRLDELKDQAWSSLDATSGMATKYKEVLDLVWPVTKLSCKVDLFAILPLQLKGATKEDIDALQALCLVDRAKTAYEQAKMVMQADGVAIVFDAASKVYSWAYEDQSESNFAREEDAFESAFKSLYLEGSQ